MGNQFISFNEICNPPLLGGISVNAMTTITIDEGTLEKIARTWETNERELERTLNGLFEQEMKELDPYFQKVMGNLQTVQRIDEGYSRKSLEEIARTAEGLWK